MSDYSDNDLPFDATNPPDPHCEERGNEREEIGDVDSSDDEYTEERGWIERVRTNPDDFWYFYEKYYDRIYRFLVKRTFDVHLAEDLTSITFTKALDNFGRYRWQGRPFLSWLMVIAKNEANGHDRKRKQRKTDPLEDVDASGERITHAGPSPDDELDERQADEALRAAMERLDPQCRTWLTLHYMEDLTVPQIAAVEGVKLGTMKARLSRCLEKLRELMRDGYE